MARRPVECDGLTAQDALAAVLGSEHLTDDRYADAVRAFELLTLRRRQDYKLLLHMVLHIIHSELYQAMAEPRDDKMTWTAVAQRLDVPVSTLWKMAHPKDVHHGRPAAEPAWEEDSP